MNYDSAPLKLADCQPKHLVYKLIKMEPVISRKRVMKIKSELGRSGEVQVTVEDSGKGIDPQNMDQIFNSFFTTKREGMGMGLSICRSIIESHGGRLWATEGSPYGAVFQFTLPPTRR
jgi:signal transduction histidine kinase